MKLRPIVPLALAVAAAASLARAPEARACGGCFATQTTVVNAHRMVLSVSPVQTVLWDQIQYSGDPQEFAWVLPVLPGARIEVGSDAWFETLDAATSVRIVSTNPNCGGGFSLGCGASDALSAAEDASGDQVTVVHRGTVGPYETVTLATDTEGALNTWLEQHGFAIDPSTQPVIDAYVAEGFDFIALRLQPGKDVKEMTPVRVVTAGASPTLPLRMVAAGAGANVAITLFVISEARLEPADFAKAAVPFDLISWDFGTQSSNYGTLREQTLAAAGGRAFLAPYAQKGALLSPVSSPNAPFGVTYTTSDALGVVDTIADAFVQQGLANDETTDGACAMNFSTHAASGQIVENPCPPGAPLDDPSCGVVASGAVDARDFACGPLDDLAVALVGLHPKDVWLTRLEANLPKETLDIDLAMVPADPQEPVDNWVRARVSIGADEFCDAAAPPAPAGPRNARTTGMLVAMAIGGLAFLAAFARRLGRRPVFAPARRTGA